MKSFFFFGLIAIFGIALLYIFRPFFYPIFWAAVIAIMFYPAYKRFLQVLKSKTLTALLTLLVIVLIIFVFGYMYFVVININLSEYMLFSVYMHKLCVAAQDFGQCALGLKIISKNLCVSGEFFKNNNLCVVLCEILTYLTCVFVKVVNSTIITCFKFP